MKKLLALFLIALLCVGIFVGCAGNDGLEAAKEYLDSIMKPKAESTPADYEVLGKVVIGQDEFAIEWSVDVTEGVKVVVAEDGKVTIDVDERAAADVAYVLKATIKDANGKTIETSYNRKVPAFKELSHSEFTQKADDEAVVVKGVITGIVNTSSKHELYLEDANGGYYVYNLAAEKMEGLQIGMEIRVLGVKGTYYGVHQVDEASVEIINATPAPVTPKDITAIVAAAANFKDAALTKLQSTLVTIKGVTVLGQDSKDKSYYNFAFNGMTSYVRISSSACMLSEADTKTFENNVKDNIGKSADMTGIVSIYNNQVYFLPVSADAYSNFTVVERTPAQQVEFEKGLMPAMGNINESGKVTLYTTPKLYNDVKITWAVSANDYATVNDGKLVIPVLPDNATEITLVATLTSGTESTTKEYKVTLEAAPTLVGDKVAVPVVGTEYKFMVKQGNTKQTLYFIGEFDSKGFMLTSTNPEKAVNVGFEAVPGKTDEFYFYYAVGTSKAYVTVSIAVGEDNKVTKTVGYARTPSNTYTYDAVRGAICTTVKSGETTKTYYFGAYNEFTTIGTSETSYIEDTSKIGVSQFVANFVTLVDTTVVSDADKVAREKNDLSIKTQFDAAGKIELPTNGGLFGKVRITWAVETNTALAIVDGELVATPQSEAVTATVTATLTHGEASVTKEFEVTVAKKPTIVPVKVDTPALDTAYKFALNQTNIDKFLYFNGTTNGFLGTSELYTEGVDVKIKAVAGETGKYTISFMDGNTEKFVEIYLNAESKARIRIVDTPTNYYTFNTEHNVYVANFPDNKTFYIGTYDTFETFSASGINYITNEGNLVAWFFTMVDTEAITDEQKVNTEKNDLSLKTQFDVAGEVQLPTAGTSFADVTITWAVETNTALAIVDGKLIATPQAAEVTATVTATITSGTVTVTKEFEVTVAKIPTLVPVKVETAPTDGLKFHIAFLKNGALLFLDGTTQSSAAYRHNSTAVITGALEYQLVAVTGGFNIKTTVGGATKYLNIVDTGSHVNLLLQDEPANVWVWDATLKTLIVNLTGKSEAYAMFNNPSFANVEAKTVSYSGNIAQLYTLVDTDSITDEQKVNTEKNDLSLKTQFDVAGEVQLPTAGTSFADVTITWAVETNTALAIVSGKLVATPQADEVTATVTATISIGSVTETKEFEVTVAKIPTATYIPVKVETAPTNGLKFHFAFLRNRTILFFNGTTQSGYDFRQNSTAVLAEAHEYEIVAVTDGFNIKTTIGGATKYLNIVVSGSYVNLLVQDEPANVWVWDAELKTLKVNVPDKGYYAIYNNPRFENAEAKSVGFSGNLVQLYMLADESTVTNEYKATIEKDVLDIPTSFSANGTLNLPSAGFIYNNVAITWTVNGTAATETYAITQTDSAQALTVIATLTLGSESVTKEFTVNVEARSNSTMVTYSAADVKGTVATTGGFTFDDSIVNITATKGTHANSSPRTSDADHFRLYAVNGTQNTFVISVDEGYVIDKIVITMATSSDHQGGTITINSADADWTVSKNGATLMCDQAATGTDNSASFEFTKQFRVYSITIYYVEA